MSATVRFDVHNINIIINLVMNKSKHLALPKPKLYVQISHLQPQPTNQHYNQHRNQVIMQPLRSAKNLHELKKQYFPTQNTEIFNSDKRQLKLRKLQQEKLTLMESLQILKMSAISAIVQKQDQLQKLRQQNTLTADDRLQLYQQELQKSRRLCQDLEQQRELMHQQMSQERARYMCDLEQKQYLIDTLKMEIEDIRTELQAFETKDALKTQQINSLLQQNSNLTQKLENHTISTHLPQIKTEFIQIKASSPTSAGSSSPRSPHLQFISPCEYENLFLSEQDRIYLNNKIQQRDRLHQSEILQLKNHYEKQIEGLKQIFDRQLNLPFKQKCTETHHTLTNSASRQSLRSHKKDKTLSYCPSDNIIEQHPQNDDIVEQDAENQPIAYLCAKQSLKYEIRANAQKQSYRRTSEDAQSQFTLNHFENPFKFTNRRKSVDTITELDLIEIKPNSVEPTQDKSQQLKQTVKYDWSKPLVFMTGLFSGITAISLVSYFLKKNRVGNS